MKSFNHVSACFATAVILGLLGFVSSACAVCSSPSEPVCNVTAESGEQPNRIRISWERYQNGGTPSGDTGVVIYRSSTPNSAQPSFPLPWNPGVMGDNAPSGWVYLHTDLYGLQSASWDFTGASEGARYHYAVCQVMNYQHYCRDFTEGWRGRPLPISNLARSGSINSATLSWSHSPSYSSTDITSYGVSPTIDYVLYRSDTPGTPCTGYRRQIGIRNNYTDSEAVAGQTYYYSIEAVARATNSASFCSGLVSVAVAAPTPTPTPTPTRTPTSTPTNTPTFTPTSTPTNTSTYTPTSTPTNVPTIAPTATFTPVATATSQSTVAPTLAATGTATAQCAVNQIFNGAECIGAIPTPASTVVAGSCGTQDLRPNIAVLTELTKSQKAQVMRLVREIDVRVSKCPSPRKARSFTVKGRKALKTERLLNERAIRRLANSAYICPATVANCTSSSLGFNSSIYTKRSLILRQLGIDGAKLLKACKGYRGKCEGAMKGCVDRTIYRADIFELDLKRAREVHSSNSSQSKLYPKLSYQCK